MHDNYLEKIKQKAKFVKKMVNEHRERLEGQFGIGQTSRDLLMRVAFLESYLIKTLPLQTEKMISNAFTNVMQSKKD